MGQESKLLKKLFQKMFGMNKQLNCAVSICMT